MSKSSQEKACVVCGKTFGVVKHHTSYQENKGVYLCRSHHSLHHESDMEVEWDVGDVLEFTMTVEFVMYSDDPNVIDYVESKTANENKSNSEVLEEAIRAQIERENHE